MTKKKKPKDRVPTRQTYLHQYEAVEDSSLRPQLTTPQNATIYRTKGNDKYALSGADTVGIDFTERTWTDRPTGEERTGYQYHERDLEERALCKYGSQEGLAKARQREQSQRDRRNASQATSSQMSTGLTPSQSIADYESDSDDLPQVDTVFALETCLRRVGKGWLWEMLDAAYLAIVPRSLRSESTGNVREQILLAAQGAFLSTYPSRRRKMSEGPSLMMRPWSRSIANLLLILADAHAMDNRTISVMDNSIKGDATLLPSDWTQAYYHKVHLAIIEIAKEYGMEGWKEVRWIMYDKYIECNLGRVYFFKAGGCAVTTTPDWEWGDSAAFWLHQGEYKMGPLPKGQFLKALDMRKQQKK